MMFCPKNSEHALSLRVRQESAAPCRIRLSGRKEARPSPAAEMSGGRFFVSILKMNFIVNIRTGLFSPSRPRCSKAHGRERFPFQRVTCEAAAPRRPAQSERKKIRFFRETTGRMAGRAKHFKQHMLSTKSAPCSPASSPAPGGFAARKERFREKPSPAPFCAIQIMFLPCSEPAMLVAASAFRAWSRPFSAWKKTTSKHTTPGNAGAYPLGRA